MTVPMNSEPLNIRWYDEFIVVNDYYVDQAHFPEALDHIKNELVNEIRQRIGETEKNVEVRIGRFLQYYRNPKIERYTRIIEFLLSK